MPRLRRLGLDRKRHRARTHLYGRVLIIMNEMEDPILVMPTATLAKHDTARVVQAKHERSWRADVYSSANKRVSRQGCHNAGDLLHDSILVLVGEMADVSLLAR